MGQNKIFIDLDGVIANWESRAIDVLGLERKVAEEHLRNGGDIYDLVPDIWERIENEGIDFWTGIEKYEWAEELVNEMKKYGEVAFLTSGGNPYNHTQAVSQAHYGKTMWVAQHFDDIPLILTREKHLCAQPDALLIDDTQAKIDKFREYGGMVYHWPHASRLTEGEMNLYQTFEEIDYVVKGK